MKTTSVGIDWQSLRAAVQEFESTLNWSVHVASGRGTYARGGLYRPSTRSVVKPKASTLDLTAI